MSEQSDETVECAGCGGAVAVVEAIWEDERYWCSRTCIARSVGDAVRKQLADDRESAASGICIAFRAVLVAIGDNGKLHKPSACFVIKVDGEELYGKARIQIPEPLVRKLGPFLYGGFELVLRGEMPESEEGEDD